MWYYNALVTITKFISCMASYCLGKKNNGLHWIEMEKEKKQANKYSVWIYVSFVNKKNILDLFNSSKIMPKWYKKISVFSLIHIYLKIMFKGFVWVALILPSVPMFCYFMTMLKLKRKTKVHNIVFKWFKWFWHLSRDDWQ